MQGVLAPLDLSEPPHEMSLQGLKERVCYFLPAQQDVTTRVEEIAVHKPGHPTMMHRLRIGSAACVAPMGVFHPKMMQPGDQQRSHRKPWRDAEEVCDDDYVAEMLLTRPGGAGQSHQDDKWAPRGLLFSFLGLATSASEFESSHPNPARQTFNPTSQFLALF